MRTKPTQVPLSRGPFVPLRLLSLAACTAGILAVALVAWLNLPGNDNRLVKLDKPEFFAAVQAVQGGGSCDSFSEGRLPPIPGVNGCVGSKTPKTPDDSGPPNPGGGGSRHGKPKGPSTPGPSGPSTPGPSGPLTPGPSGTSKPLTPGPSASPGQNPSGPPTPLPSSNGGGDKPPGGPFTGEGGNSGGGQGKQPAEEASQDDESKKTGRISGLQVGSVETSTGAFHWAVADAVFPGVLSDNGLNITRRYYSRLEHDGTWSTGARWVSSLSEKIVEEEENGERVLRHFDWKQPYNDPDLYFHETSSGSGTFAAPVVLGSTIVVDEVGGVINGYTLFLKDGDKHSFDRQGRVTAQIDAFGNTIAFEYTDPIAPPGAGILSLGAPPSGTNGQIKITDTRGAIYYLVLDPYGYMTKITDPLGHVTTYGYTTVGSTKYLTQVTYPARDVYENGALTYRTTKLSYTYNAQGRLEEIRNDTGGLELRNIYDWILPYRVQQQIQANGGVFYFQWPVLGTTRVTTPRGFRREYDHNMWGQAVEIREYIANFGLEPARTLNTSLHHKWVLGRANTSCNCGPISKVTEPDGGLIDIVYDAKLNLLELHKKAPVPATDELVWKWGYDSKNRVVSHIPPEGNASANPALFTFSYIYGEDANGKVIQITKSVPGRELRSTPTVWISLYDSMGRTTDEVGTSHSSGANSFDGHWDYHPAGGANAFLAHKLSSLDANTVTYTYSWDLNGRPQTVTDANGNLWSTIYDSHNRISRWTAPSLGGQQHQHEWAYDRNGRVARIRWKYFPNPPGSGSAAQYSWVEWLYSYDAMGNLTEDRHDLDSSGTEAIYRYEYDLGSNLKKTTDPDGYTTAILSDERGYPWIVTMAKGTSDEVSRVYDYNSQGDLETIIDQVDSSRSVVFHNEYDDFDRLEKYWVSKSGDPSTQGGFIKIGYDAGSRVTDFKTYGAKNGAHHLVEHKILAYDDWHDSATSQTTKVYNAETGAFARQIESKFYYGSTGLPLYELVGGIVIAGYDYEPWGAPSFVYDQHNNSVRTTYDALGDSVTVTTTHDDPINTSSIVFVRSFTRDAFGRTVEVKDSGAGVPDRVHKYGYDSNDNTVTYETPDGKVHRYEYRFDGALIKQELQIGGGIQRATQYSYSLAGLLASVIDERSNAVSYIYDHRGRFAQESHPDGTLWTNTHNLSGLLTSIKSPTGREVILEYDWRGMLTKQSWKDASGSLVRTDDFEIDPAGNIGKVTRSENGLVHWVDLDMDGMGLVMSQQVGGAGMPTDTTSYVRNNFGLVQSITGPTGVQHVYTYDDRHRVKTLSAVEGASTVTVAIYDYLGAGGTVTRREHGNGTQQDISRDGFGRVTGLTTSGPQNQTVNNFAYTYDSRGLLKSEDRLHDGKGDVYRYDDLARLTSMTHDTTDVAAELANPQSTAHAYYREFLMDGDYHRSAVKTTPQGGATTQLDYSTDPKRHHYTGIQEVGQPIVSRTFDLDGRLTSHGTRTFEYDQSDSLIEVKDGGSTTVSYTYDALGRRWTKTANGKTIRFVNAGPWVIEEHRQFSGSTAWDREAVHFHGSALDEVVMSRHCDCSDLDQDTDVCECVDLYLHANRQGSTTEITDSAGTVVERIRYDAYGRPEFFSGTGAVLASSAVGNDILFTGREYNPETGLYDYRARTYDPSTGSFLQEDPQGLSDGVNLVAYVKANPVNFSDPYGTASISETITTIMDFISKNRDLVADLLLDMMGPLEGILDIISAVTGTDITGWVRGGMKGAPQSMGWWARAIAGAAAAAKVAAGAFRILAKLTGILDKMKKLAQRAKAAAGKIGRKLCKIGGGNKCFVLGTLVMLASGELVPIEDVAVGDLVLAEIPATVAGLEGEKGAYGVTATPRREYSGALHTIVVEGRDGTRAEITGTPEHPFWSPEKHRWVPMAELRVGDVLDASTGEAQVIDRGVDFGKLPVLNLEVGQAHAYRISPLGVLVHNMCAAKGGGRSANKLKPNPKATGPHSTWKSDANGNVTGHAEWQPNPKNPSGFDQAMRVDTQHANPHSHGGVPTPHTHSGGRVRPATPGELPK